MTSSFKKPQTHVCYHSKLTITLYNSKNFFSVIGTGLFSLLITMSSGLLRKTKENPSVVQAYIDVEKEAGRLLPVQPKHHLPQSKCQISPFGVIPKRYQPGKWRLIIDLSSPEDASVNDGIDARLCSLDYPTVHDAAKIVRELGKGALLVKLDLKNAYRVVPVNPQDHPLLAMKWDDEVLIDGALPFGLRSAPKIFTAVADTLM